MKSKIALLLHQANIAKAKYATSQCTREEARKEIKPFEEAFNEISTRNAKKYGVKPRLFNFSSFVR